MAGFQYQSLYFDVGHYLSHLRPKDGDMTFAILKAHLAVEQVLQDYLEKRLPHPEQLEGTRLMFANTLALVRSVCPDPNHFVFGMAQALNGLRNKLAHNLEPSQMVEKTRAFSRDCHQRFTGEDSPEKDDVRDFELAVTKLFGFLTSVLGLHGDFIPPERKVSRLS